jgi:ech hydrogenase subunit B
VIEVVMILMAPIIGGLLYGLERVITARMQNRQGPPVLQPFYDMFKLLDKRIYIIHPYHAILGVLHALSLWAVVALLILGGNLLYVLFLHLFATLIIVLAGYSVRSIYSHIGSNRELMVLVAYEPILILIASAFYLINGSFEITEIRENSPQILLLLPLFIAFLLTMPIKLKKSPFDAAEAHQEIVGGVEVEYGGAYYEFVYLAKWLEYLFVYGLALLFAGDNALLGLLLVASLFLLVNLVDNATARIRTDHLLRITLGIGLALALTNLIGLALWH